MDANRIAMLHEAVWERPRPADHPRSWDDVREGEAFVWDGPSSTVREASTFVVVTRSRTHVSLAITHPRGHVKLTHETLERMNRVYSFSDPTFRWRRLPSSPER